VEPEVQRRRHRDTVGLQVNHVIAASRDARTLQDHVARQELLESALGGDENVGFGPRGVVDEDQSRRNVA
jgi:hypothetical protein